MTYIEKYKEWCNSPLFDNETKKELKNIEKNDKEIEDRFYKDLEFGTGGLRGIIGAGTNRMNRYTVGRATQGLANYIKKNNKQDRGVAIAYDSRNMSKEFSKEVALCLNANGIKTYRFESLRPTPELSFAVRKLSCIAGIVITASHNPPEYNGYKVYWEDGGQIVAPYDKDIIEEVNLIKDYNEIKMISEETAKKQGLYNILGKEIDDLYIQELKNLILNPDIIRKVQKDIKIVYTPLHGTGRVLVQRILKEIGFENVYTVKEQEEPDGNFSTVKYPNPEEKTAFKLALDLAKKVNADIVLATDPDADRLGVYVKDIKTESYIPLTGNMSGLLIAEYELSEKKKKDILPSNGAIVKTIVSSNMAKKMAEEYQLKLKEVLTGFKYIGEQIKKFEEEKDYEYVFGYEESYGCLIGTYARDKDAISAVMALCEAMAYYKDKGLTLWEQMLNIYEKYGFYKEDLNYFTFQGPDGKNKINQIIEKLRNNKMKKLGDFEIIAIRDYLLNVKKYNNIEKEEKLDLPKSNVLYYELDNEAWFCARPSGTEPKIKFYMGVLGDNLEDANIRLEKLKEEILECIK